MGASLTLLDDGRALVTGGNSWLGNQNAGIYDPLKNEWTKLPVVMHEERYYHGTLLLENGKVLIVGGQSAGDWNTGYSHEIYDPVNNTFTVASNSQDIHGSSCPILLDDGNVLVFGFGDFFNPSNTKVIETYNVSANTWSSPVYTSIGAIEYTAHKLNNHKILIIGGSFTTYNGASPYCYLITPTNISLCYSLPANIPVAGNSVCFGTDGTVTLTGSEPGVTYRPYINGMAVASQKTGGGNITFTIPPDKLKMGSNTVMISAKKPGCEKIILGNTATINIYQAVTQPVISHDALTICAGENVQLSGPPGYSEYLWTNDSLVQDISVKNSGRYALQVKDNAGCLSDLSDSVQVTVNLLPAVNVGNDQSSCISSTPFALSGYLPAGGAWAGTGVNTSGTFDPSSAGTGTHELIYAVTENNCSNTDTMNMVVDNNASPTLSIEIISGTNPTFANNNISFKATITNGGSAPQYQWMVNSILQGSNSDQFTFSGWNDQDQVSCVLTSSEACALPSQVSLSPIVISVYEAPKVLALDPARHSSTSGGNANISANFSQSLDPSKISSSNIKMYGNIRGIFADSGSFFMPDNKSFTFDPLTHFYAGEKISVTIKNTLENSVGTPMIKPFVYRFRSRPNSTTGNLNGGYYDFSPNAAIKDVGIGNFTNDTIVDVITLSEGYVVVSQFKDNATLKTNITSTGFATSSRLFTADFDQDGDLDVATAGDQNPIILGYNNGYGSFPFAERVTLPNGSDQVTGADLDGDGDVDLISNERTIKGFNVFKNNGSGNFTLSNSYAIPSAPVINYGFDLEDYDNDGDLDLSIVSQNPYAADSVFFFSNNGDATFVFHSAFETMLNPGYAACEDFNNDGNIDIAVMNVTSNNVTVYLNDGSMNFTLSNTLNGFPNYPLDIVSADFEGDGDLDIGVTTSNYDGFYVYSNNGNGTFGSPVVYYGGGPKPVATGDLDMDGDVDVAIASDAVGVHVLWNNGTIPKILKPVLTKTIFCAGATETISVSSKGKFINATNVYTVQLSDNNGSFSSSVVIGTVQTGSNNPGVGITFPADTKAGNYKMRIISSNPALVGDETDIKVQTSVPPTPIIYGPGASCKDQAQTYKIIREPDVKYNWFIVYGGYFAGTATDSTRIFWNVAGNGGVRVVPSNGCGNGTQQILPVTVSSASAVVNVITGNTSACPGRIENYSVPQVNGEVRTWSINEGSLLNTSGDVVSVIWGIPQSGINISVNAIHVCGTTTSTVLPVTINPDAKLTGPISGNSIVIENSSEAYSVLNNSGSTYKWIIDGGNGSSTTNSILINWNSVGTGTIKVVEVTSDLCESDTIYLTVTINQVSSTIDMLEKNILIYPNPSQGIFLLSANQVNFNEAEIIVTNLFNEEVFHDNISSSINNGFLGRIDISSHLKGVYFVKIISNGIIINKKIILN